MARISGGPGSGFVPLPQNPGTESALGSHPCVALSSAQMLNSLDQPVNLCHPVVGFSPLVELRTTPNLSKQWGPPQMYFVPLTCCLTFGVHSSGPIHV